MTCCGLQTSASMTVELQPNATGTCIVDITLSEMPETVVEPLSVTVKTWIRVEEVNRAPSFAIARDRVLVVESSGAHQLRDVLGNITTGNDGGNADSEPMQLITFSVTTLSAPVDLFHSEPHITAAGVLSFRLAEGKAGSASLTILARDDGGTRWGGEDTSAGQRVTVHVLPRPRLDTVKPSWWMATEIPSSQLTLTVRGSWLPASAPGHAPDAVPGVSPAATQLGMLAMSAEQMLAEPPAVGVYVLVAGQPCHTSVLVSDSEVHCVGFDPFPSTALINVRVVEQEPHDPNARIVREATLGDAQPLSRIELIVGGSTRDGRGFVATSGSGYTSLLRLWQVTPDRSVRSLTATSASGSVYVGGTFQSVSSPLQAARAGGAGRKQRAAYVLSAAGTDGGGFGAPAASTLGHGLDGAVTGMVKVAAGAREWLLVAGSFVSAFRKHLPSVTATRAEPRRAVVKSGGLMLWGPRIDWSRSHDSGVSYPPSEQQDTWQEVGGLHAPRGAMTALAVFYLRGVAAGTDSAGTDRPLVFVAGRFSSSSSSQSPGGLLMLDWVEGVWSGLCGAVDSSAAANTSAAAGGFAAKAQGCGVRGGDVLAISVAEAEGADALWGDCESMLCRVEVVVGGTFTFAGSVRDGGVPGTRALAAWSGRAWHSLGVFDPKASVRALARLGRVLYVGGSFTAINGHRYDNLARFVSGVWSNVGGGVRGTVFSLAALATSASLSQGASLLVGGDISAVGQRMEGRSEGDSSYRWATTRTADRHGYPIGNLVRWSEEEADWDSLLLEVANATVPAAIGEVYAMHAAPPGSA